MAGEAQNPDTPDDPGSSPDPAVLALATRIERAMRACFVFVAPAEVDAQAYEDMRAIADGADNRVRSGEKRPAAARSARIHWLAGVLAGAMGERKTEKEPTDGEA